MFYEKTMMIVKKINNFFHSEIAVLRYIKIQKILHRCILDGKIVKEIVFGKEVL